MLEEVVESVRCRWCAGSAPSSWCHVRGRCGRRGRDAAGMSEEPGWDGPLPEAVRLRVVTLAADTLGALPEDDVPAALKRFRSWAPQHRRTRAATPLAAAVERDVVFRQRVAGSRPARSCPTWLPPWTRARRRPPPTRSTWPRSPTWAVRRGGPRWSALPPRRPSGRRPRRAARGRPRRSRGSRPPWLRSRPGTRSRSRALRAELAAATAEAAAVAKALREEKGARRRAERASAEAAEAVAAAESSGGCVGAWRPPRRCAGPGPGCEEAETALEASRRAVREGRSLEDTRLRLLLDTVVEAAAGAAPRAGPAAGRAPARPTSSRPPARATGGPPERALLVRRPGAARPAARRCRRRT